MENGLTFTPTSVKLMLNSRHLMSFARTMGEGPHFYEWMREFNDSEADRRVMLILNTDNHPDDDTLWRLMEQHWGQ